MKKLFLASATVLASSTYANAADIITYVEPVAPFAAPETHSWEGGYIGFNAGYLSGEFKNKVEHYDIIWNWKGSGGEAPRRMPLFEAAGGNNVDFDGAIFGIQTGYNWQAGSTVFGIEADFQILNVKKQSIALLPTTFLSGVENETEAHITNRLDWFSTLRGRVGFTPTDRLLVYGTAGLALGHMRTNVVGEVNDGAANPIVSAFDEGASKTQVGWTAGAGAEYAISSKWSLKTEYLYTDLGTMKFGYEHTNEGDFDTTKAFLGETSANFHTVRIGLNYKF